VFRINDLKHSGALAIARDECGGDAPLVITQVLIVLHLINDGWSNGWDDGWDDGWLAE